jgi:hypothetical protein
MRFQLYIPNQQAQYDLMGKTQFGLTLINHLEPTGYVMQQQG